LARDQDEMNNYVKKCFRGLDSRRNQITMVVF
jgi:hypothetical protein